MYNMQYFIIDLDGNLNNHSKTAADTSTESDPVDMSQPNTQQPLDLQQEMPRSVLDQLLDQYNQVLKNHASCHNPVPLKRMVKRDPSRAPVGNGLVHEFSYEEDIEVHVSGDIDTPLYNYPLVGIAPERVSVLVGNDRTYVHIRNDDGTEVKLSGEIPSGYEFEKWTMKHGLLTLQFKKIQPKYMPMST